MGLIAKVISSKIDDNNTIICTVEKSFGHNIQVPLYLSPGDDSFPLPNDRIFITPEIGTGNFIGVGILSEDQGSLSGEKTLYSRDSNGAKKASIYLKTDGTLKIDTDLDVDVNSSGNVTVDGTLIELNGNTKTFVTYADLNTALQLLITALNTHVHTSAAAGSPTSSPVTPLTLDISASETTTIKTGG